MLHNTMANKILNLFCLVDGEGTSNAFSVKVASTDTVDGLKKLIKAEKTNKFSDFDADQFTLWRVSIPVVPANRHKPIFLNEIESPVELDPTDDVSEAFPSRNKLPKKTIHVIVQRPPAAQSPHISDYISQKRPTTDELDLPANKKIRITEGWRRYTASDGTAVDLPPSWINILASTEFVPEPRAAFDHLKDDLRAGDAIIVPSMGQLPKDFGLHGQGHRLFVTEQML
ncbi:hypothetical protein K457DRAFT_234897 [Linnemannia elongata AG-77]|uniref:Crinkler effector protein N-terminal domain-containing protein n=1 Tax=Linnemannia elongata AG-77 TaxID=1314771 RepID=A0A197JE40_9FUNG|nr:hypothetical protein K457DRAFT_234897 [Linnemannia elongata AG-77]